MTRPRTPARPRSPARRLGRWEATQPSPAATSAISPTQLSPVARRAHWGLVAGLVGAGMALRLWLILRGWPDLDSDVAILGLMARHIVYNGASPLFYYGQHYNGLLEAYFPAAAFVLLGPTTLALNLATLPLLAIFLLAMYALGRAAYGPAVGLLTLTYLALGPALGLLLGIVYPFFGVADGFGALLFLLVYARLRRAEPLPIGWTGWAKGLAHYALIGLIIGLGLWSAPLIVPFVLAAIMGLVFGRPRETRHLPGLARHRAPDDLDAGGWRLHDGESRTLRVLELDRLRA